MLTIDDIKAKLEGFRPIEKPKHVQVLEAIKGLIPGMKPEAKPIGAVVGGVSGGLAGLGIGRRTIPRASLTRAFKKVTEAKSLSPVIKLYGKKVIPVSMLMAAMGSLAGKEIQDTVSAKYTFDNKDKGLRNAIRNDEFWRLNV